MMEECTYIKQDGDKIRWFGSTLFNDNAINSKKGFEYANEAQGYISYRKSLNGNGTSIHLTWDDVSVSDNHLKGTVNLYVYDTYSVMKVLPLEVTGGFGPSEWTRKC